MSDKIIEAFKQDLIEDGKATKTIISYVGDVKSFLEWLKASSVAGSFARVPGTFAD